MRKYNTLAELQRDEGGAKDTRGHASEKPVTFGKAWGALVQLSASELVAFNQRYPTATHQFTTHYQPGTPLDETCWLKLMDGSERILHIIGIDNERNANRTWILMLSEQVKVRK